MRLPKGCVPRVGAFLDEYARLSPDTDVWPELTITDRAGLILHESVYAIRRILFDDKDSDLSRQVTGALLTLARFDSTDVYREITARLGGQDIWAGFRHVILPASGQLVLEAQLSEGKKASVEFIEAGKRIVGASVSTSRPQNSARFSGFDSEAPMVRIRGGKDCLVNFRIRDLATPAHEIVCECNASCSPSGVAELPMIKIGMYWSMSPIATESQHNRILGW